MIVSSGESLIDFVPQTQEAAALYRPCPGGSPFNVAIAMARLGAATGFLGKMSRDFFGDMLHSRLQEENVDLRFVSRTDRLTTLAFVKLADGSEPRYAFYTENSADRNLAPIDVPQVFPEEVSCLEFGSISLLMEPEASTLKELVKRHHGKIALSFDPNIRPMMVPDKRAFLTEVETLVSLSTVVKVSAADLEWLYPGRPAEERASGWLALGAGIVVMTRGKDGAVLFGPNYRVETGEYWVEVKDTIGAGDSFHAALLVRLDQLGRLHPRLAQELTEEEAADAVYYAVKASSLNCAREGADPPTATEMDAAK